MIIKASSNGKVVSKEQSLLLGDRIANATKAVGIKPCGGCKKRQKAINKADQATRDFINKIKTKVIS